MQITRHKPLMTLLMSLALILALGVTASIAQETQQVAGKLTMAYTKMDTISISDTEGHAISLGEAKGSNADATDQGFMDGAEVANCSFADLVMGNGHHQGYITFSKGDDSTIAKWQGKVQTASSEEGAAATEFEGTFTWIKGTGKFENIKGEGTYRGAFTSKTEYTVEWEGEYSIEK